MSTPAVRSPLFLLGLPLAAFALAACVGLAAESPAPAASAPAATVAPAPASDAAAAPAVPSDAPASAAPVKPDLGGDLLVFSYFKGGGDGLHLAWSDDGLKWTPIKNDQVLIRPTLGPTRLFRDPSIVRGPDGVFHAVWTTGWNDNIIGYASSKDLLNWTEQRGIPVMQHEPTVRNTWAPEITYDDVNKEFIIYWASTIPGKFTDSATPDAAQASARGASNTYNHRMYFTKTKDFQEFAPTALFYEPGFSVIDCFIVKDGGKYVMVLKDERDRPNAQKNLKIATSDNAAGPYSAASEPFSGTDWVEGPAVIKVGDQWFVYFDKYRMRRYGLLATKDWKTWEDLTQQLQLPNGIRHGTVFRAPKALVEAAAKTQ